MIIYNVTLSILPEVETEVLSWLKKTHIPEVLDTNLFISGQMFKVIENPDDRSHNSYAIQYKLENWEKFEEYNNKHADALRAKTQNMFGERVLAFRTFLEEL